MQRSYKVCICLSLQQRLENSRTTPPMPRWTFKKKHIFSDCFYTCHVYVVFLNKTILKHVTNESDVKEPSLSSISYILLYIDDRKPNKSRNLSRFKFQVKLLGLLTRLFGLQQHKRQNQFTNRINGPPGLFSNHPNGLAKNSARDITTTCKGVKPPTMPTSSIGSKGCPST